MLDKLFTFISPYLYIFVQLFLLMTVFTVTFSLLFICRGSKRRSVWFFVHWILGTGVSLLGIINIFTGLQAYHRKASRNVRFWTILFIAEISFITFFYLFQDKWDYMQKQGVILGNDATRPCDQELSQRVDKEEETGLC